MKEKNLRSAFGFLVGGVTASALSGIGFYEALEQDRLSLFGISSLFALAGAGCLSIAAYESGYEKQLHT